MFSNLMAIVEFLNLCADVYLWIDDKITDMDFQARCKKRKELRNTYISTEKERIKLEVLRDIERNDPRHSN